MQKVLNDLFIEDLITGVRLVGKSQDRFLFARPAPGVKQEDVPIALRLKKDEVAKVYIALRSWYQRRSQ